MEEQKNEILSLQPVTEYLTKKHKTLLNDYKTEDGKYSESCGEIAFEVAELFLKSGKQPQILDVRGERLSDGVNTKTIVPKIYGGRIKWGGHMVCAVGDTVFDPMIGKPMEAEAYKQDVFSDPVTLKRMLTTEYIKEVLQREA